MTTARIRNVFADEEAARRYAKGRVFFHPQVMERIADLPGVRGGLGLDVGCGTGLSTRALAGLCRRVVGVDPAPAMIARFERAERMDPVVATAECLPLRDGCCDVITLSQAIHWLEWAAFAAEARRVLRAGGWVVVYDQSFAGDDPFTAWYRGVFQERFPPPSRRDVAFKTPEHWATAGFRLVRNELFEATRSWTSDELVDFLASQSNVIACADGADAAREWLREATRPFFAGAPSRSFTFDGPIVCATPGPP